MRLNALVALLLSTFYVTNAIKLWHRCQCQRLWFSGLIEDNPALTQNVCVESYKLSAEWRAGLQQCHAVSHNLLNKDDFAVECERLALKGYWPVIDSGFDMSVKKNITWSCLKECRVHCD